MKQMLVAILIAAFAGCQEEGVRVIKAPKPPDAATRMLVVMVPRDDATWFLKLSGPSAAVAEDEAAFQKFAESVKFVEGERPMTWTLPDGWKEGSNKAQRYATLKTASDIEVTITNLGPHSGELLDNVNRWRGQIGMPPVTADELPKMSRDISVGGAKAYRVDLLNSGLAAVPLRPLPKSSPSPTSGGQDLRITYQAPAGWEEKPASGMRVATFSAGDAEVLITPLAGLSGDLASNVNRWRGQVGLPAASEDAIKAAAKELPIAGQNAPYVDLLGPDGPKRQRMLVTIVDRGGRTWFVKLIGPAETVARQQAAFEAFCRSLQFAGAKDG